jgi:hypothetical protein
MHSSDSPTSAGGFGRRAFLTGVAAGGGLLLARGLGARRWLGTDVPPRTYAEALRALGASLTPKQRQLIVFPADHPTRQIVNTLSVIERPHLGTLLSPTQRVLVEQLYDTMLSAQGRDAFAGTIAVEGRLDGCVLAIYGEPETNGAQAVIMGGHLMLRGGESSSAAAFGGGVGYGHQVGNLRWRVAGNSFAYHGDAANRLYAHLDPDQRQRAVLPAPPHELVLQPQPLGAKFPGVRFGRLAEPAKEAAAQLLDAVFSCYPAAARGEAGSCIAANGGLDALHVAYYASHGFYPDMEAWAGLDAAERQRRGDPYWQIWRIEGPGTVVHFKGYPHVHAYIQVVRDAARANIGESLGTTAVAIEGAPLRGLLEGAIRRASGEALAFHSDELPGRFCPGEITTGLAYALDPYHNHISVATIAGRAMAAPLRERIEAGGVVVNPQTSYRVASTDYSTRQRDSFGDAEKVDVSTLLLRDALVDHLRAGGLAQA